MQSTSLLRWHGQILSWVQLRSGFPASLVQLNLHQESRIKPRFLSTVPARLQPLIAQQFPYSSLHRCGSSLTPCRCYSTPSIPTRSSDSKTPKKKGPLTFRGPRVHEVPYELVAPDDLEEDVDLEAVKKEKIYQEIRDLENKDLYRIIVNDDIDPFLPKQHKVGIPDPDEPYKHLGDANPFTVDPELVPVEMRWAIIELQEDYKRLMPFHEEFKNSKVFDKFNQEVDKRINELNDAWMNNPEPANKHNNTERQVAQDKLYDELLAKFMQTALDDPANEEELMSMKYVQEVLPKLIAAEENMPTVVREILKDEEDPLQPKMTHQIHKQISDTLLGPKY